ncbi:MAG: hypothetical protein WCR95_07010 [Eubacteriales bacterium]
MLKKFLFVLLALSVITFCVSIVSCTKDDNNTSSYDVSSLSPTSSLPPSNNSRDTSGNNTSSGDIFDNASIGDDLSDLVSDALSRVTK